MNIFVFSEAAWDDKISFGNTVSNFFCGDVWENDRFSAFYARKQLPDNRAKVSYYNLSAGDILKGILKGRIEGRQFSSNDLTEKNEESEYYQTQERKNIDRIHKKKNEFIYWIYEQVWRSRLWTNKSFDAFIKKNNPEIVFAFAIRPYILWPLILYLKKFTQCRIVLMIADDVYGSYKQYAWYRRGYTVREFEKCIHAADMIYGISDEISEYYGKMFGKHVKTLFKGCDLSVEPKKYLNHPLRFVYAGNLLWGRDDTLALVAKALEEINRNGIMAVLEIYTGATITDILRKKLDKDGSSKIMGVRPYDKIKKIMHDADVVLHVESFEQKAIDYVKYSFSTKIIDCLQSGSQVLGIGPDGIASINYLKKVDGAIVIDDLNEIKNVVSQVIQEGHMLENAERTRKYALQNHEISVVQRKLREEFENTINSDNVG